jgi:hypothetical protein
MADFLTSAINHERSRQILTGNGGRGESAANRDKEARLAAALRANLRRRKDQMRARRKLSESGTLDEDAKEDAGDGQSDEDTQK